MCVNATLDAKVLLASCLDPFCLSECCWMFIEGTPILFVVRVHHLGVDLVAHAIAELPVSCPLP